VARSLDQIQPGLGNPVMKVEVRDIQSVNAVNTPASRPGRAATSTPDRGSPARGRWLGSPHGWPAGSTA